MKQTVQLRPVNGGYGERTTSTPFGSDVQLTPIGKTESHAYKTNSRTSTASMGIIPRVNSFQIQMTLPDLSDWKSTIEEIAGAKIIQIINLDSESLITDIILNSSTSSQSVMLQLNFSSRINVDDIKYQIQNKWSKLNTVMQIAEPKDGKSVTDEDTAFNSQARFLSNKILKKLDILMSNVNPIQNTIVSPKPSPVTCGINPYIMTAEQRVTCNTPITGKLIKIQAPSQAELLDVIPALESTLNSKVDAIVIYGKQVYPSKESIIVNSQSGGGDIYEVYFTTPSVTEMAVANILTNTTMSVISATGAKIISELSLSNKPDNKGLVTPIINIGKCGIDPSLMSEEQKNECNVVNMDDIVTPIKVEAPSLDILLHNIEAFEISLNTTIVSIMLNGVQVYPIMSDDPSIRMTGGGNDIYDIYFHDTTITEDDASFIVQNNIDMQNDGIIVIMSTTTPQATTTITTPQATTTITTPQATTPTKQPQVIDIGVCGIDPSVMSQEQKDACNIVNTDDIVAPIKIQAPSLDALLNNIEGFEISLNTTIVSIMLNGEQVYPIMTDDPSILMTGGGNEIYEIYFDDITITNEDVSFIIQNNTDMQTAGITVIMSTTPEGSTTTTRQTTTMTPPQTTTTTPPQTTTTTTRQTTTMTPPQTTTTTPPQTTTTTPPQTTTTTPPKTTTTTTPQTTTMTPQTTTTTPPQTTTTTPQASTTTTTPQTTTTTPPQTTTTTPQTTTTTPPQTTTTTTTPQTTTTTPPQTTTTTTPQASTTTPQASTTTPPQASTTTPQASTTTPQASTTTPQASTTTPQESTTTPQGSTTTPLRGGYRRTKRATKEHRKGTYRYYRKRT